jgi:transaldolase
MNTLEQLKQYSTVVADTGELEAMRRFRPEDATTNPSLILKAVQSGQYDTVLDQVIDRINKQCLSDTDRLEAVCDALIVAMGCQILELVPGRVSTEVDARLSFDTQASIVKARTLIQLYEAAGIPKERVLIKLAATWEGIRAAEVLEREGINCNLTLIFAFEQAQACAEADVFLISPFVGRILDWYKAANPGVQYAPKDEPGVESVQRIQRYFKAQNYLTVVMGASFRNAGEIIALAGCDRLTISPALLEALSEQTESITPFDHSGGEALKAPLTESAFRLAMNGNAMATEKLAEGIRGFEADQERLEILIQTRISERL